MKTYIAIVIIWLVVIFIVVNLLAFALKKNDIEKCHKFQSYAETYQDFYLTATEKEMCDSVGVDVLAEVKFVK